MKVNKEIKVIVKMDFKNETMKKILPLGFETTLQTIVSTEEKIIHNDVYTKRVWDKDKLILGQAKLMIPKAITPIGNYVKSLFKGADGMTYDSSILGFLTLEKVFDKNLIS